jgi:hypothetical protein
MHDALDSTPPVRLPAPRVLLRPRRRRLFLREAFDDWEGTCRGDMPRG